MSFYFLTKKRCKHYNFINQTIYTWDYSMYKMQCNYYRYTSTQQSKDYCSSSIFRNQYLPSFFCSYDLAQELFYATFPRTFSFVRFVLPIILIRTIFVRWSIGTQFCTILNNQTNSYQYFYSFGESNRVLRNPWIVMLE